MTAAELEVVDLALRLGSRQVLDDIRFAVPAGRVVGLLGPNGAGKTTTMRVLFDIVAPDRGEVRWRGRPATPADRARWGYLPQERGLYPKMPAGAHVEHIGRLRGLGAGDARARAAALLERVGLADRAGEKVERLSGGMQQRLQLACALVHEPEVLVLDEPFAGLDLAAIDELSAVVREQVEAGRTVLFSSHQLDVVEDLCEAIVLVDAGRVVLQGDLAELKAASDRRLLRLDVDAADGSWPELLPGTSVVRREGAIAWLRIGPGDDPLAVLDAARALGAVRDFGLVQPPLSQLFRDAVGQAA